MTTVTIEQARRMLQIDRDDLSREIQEQPEVYYQVAQARVEAESARDYAKDDMENVEASTAVSIRRRADKISETEIKQRVADDRKVQQARKEYRNAKEKASRWLAVEDAHKQRGFMIRELARVMIATMGPDSVGSSPVRGDYKRNRERHAESRRGSSHRERGE